MMKGHVSEKMAYFSCNSSSLIGFDGRLLQILLLLTELINTRDDRANSHKLNY
jgi:hypothetical protein